MASGDTLATFFPTDNERPSANGAQDGLRNNRPCLLFDQSTDESAVFSDVLNRAYAGGGVTVSLYWAADGVTVNDVIWDVAFERVGDGQLDIDGDSFAAVQSVTDTAPGTDGFVTTASVAFTDGAQMDSVAVGELYRLKVTRDADNGSDTLAADTQLFAVELTET